MPGNRRQMWVQMGIGPILKDGVLAEVEVSVTAKCTLACHNCGFLVPHQPEPSHGDAADEHAAGLERIANCGIRIRSLAIVGGEPTLNAELLARAARRIRAVAAVDRIEVVSNGLTPQGVTVEALAVIDRLTISDYGYDARLIDLWRQWLAAVAPHVELLLRDGQTGWDPCDAAASVGSVQAQSMWANCWYRKHCVTLERGRLFACSRIPKLSRDTDGLPLTGATTYDDIEAYLNGPHALPSCATCTLMMGRPTVAGGVQPDDRIQRLQRRAIDHLQARLGGGATGRDLLGQASAVKGQLHE